MRLISIKIEPLGQHGWESPVLEFGKRTTLLYARNGSGKTPIIQAITACLGFPPKFRDEIYGKCSAVTLVLESTGELLIIQRILGSNNRDFHARLTYQGNESVFYNESTFSSALFCALGLEPPRLLSNKGEVAQPYFSTVLPVFYVNQVDGYTLAYKSSSSFILDQFVEMVRFVFGMNPKHSFDVKKNLVDEKAALEAQTRKIVATQRVIEYQSRGVDERESAEKELKRNVEELISNIETLKVTVDTKGAASSALYELLRQKENQIRAKQTELSELQNRISGIDTIRTEIEGEIRTLGLNEEARRVFSSFNEICGSSNCRLFMGSTESYGKNLLYLRDQIKDLDRNTIRAEMRIEQLEETLELYRSEHQSLADKLDLPDSREVDQLVTAVQSLTKVLVEAQTSLGRIAALKEERMKLFKMEEERARIQDRIESLSNSSRADLKFTKLRHRLRELAVKWMDILETKNVSRNVEIDLDLRFTFNGESLDLFSGSTRIRIVLAIHAALFEEYLSEPTRPFRFLILDTPKQQELHTEDLASYLNELEKLCIEKDAQLIFSSTEYSHPTGPDDMRWLPMYKGEEHPMYLGTHADYLG